MHAGCTDDRLIGNRQLDWVQDERPGLRAAEPAVEGDQLLERAALFEVRVVEAVDHDVGDMLESVRAPQVRGCSRGEGRERVLSLDPAGRTLWVALPHPAWVEYKKRTGKVITDTFAVEIAGHYLKTALESGEGVGREMYSLTVEETLKHLEAVVSQPEVQPVS